MSVTELLTFFCLHRGLMAQLVLALTKKTRLLRLGKVAPIYFGFIRELDLKHRLSRRTKDR